MTDHKLASPWNMMFMTNVTKELLQAHSNDYPKAQAAALKEVGVVDTIEQVCSTFNSIPRVSLLNHGDSYLLVRQGRKPSFENYPGGSRFLIDTKTDEETKEVINVLLMAIVGENVVKGSGAISPCHVVRMTHKVSQAAANGVRFEVWMDKEEVEGQYVQMQLYFQNLLKGKAIELKPLV